MLFTLFAIPVVAVLGVFTYLIVQAVAQSVCEASKHRADAELKIALAQRGMSAAEIEQIVAARPGATSHRAPYANERQTPSTAMPPQKEPVSPR